MFLIVVDAHSKWLEVVPMLSTTSTVTIGKLRKIFATHGLPEMIVTDNGPQFISEEFRQRRHRITRHRMTWEREQCKFLRRECEKRIRRNYPLKKAKVLFSYRATPQSTTGISLAELLYGCDELIVNIYMLGVIVFCLLPVWWLLKPVTIS